VGHLATAPFPDNRLATLMHMDMLYGDLLLALATMAVQSLEK
jgi:hypothetical protein